MTKVIEKVNVLVHSGFSLTGNDRINILKRDELHPIEVNLRNCWDECVEVIASEGFSLMIYVSPSKNILLGKALRGEKDMPFAVVEDAERIWKYHTQLGKRLVVMSDYDETYHLVNPRRVLERREMVVSPEASLVAMGEFVDPCVEYWRVRSTTNLKINPARSTIIENLSMTWAQRSIIAQDLLSSHRSFNPG